MNGMNFLHNIHTQIQKMKTTQQLVSVMNFVNIKNVCILFFFIGTFTAATQKRNETTYCLYLVLFYVCKCKARVLHNTKR